MTAECEGTWLLTEWWGLLTAGVVGLNRYMQSKWTQAYEVVTRKGAKQFEHVFVDMNGVIHPALREAQDEESLILNLFRQLDRMLAYVQPTRSVTLAVDGPAPVAKLSTQRERRAEVCNGKRMQKCDLMKMAITPGSELMSERIAEALKYYCAQRLGTQKYKGVVFEVCGPDVPGEGEVKMLGKVEGLSKGSSCVLVGNDSDLLLLALARKNCKPAVLQDYLPAPGSHRKKQPAMMLFRSDKFEQLLLSHLPKGAPAYRSKLDFITLCCMSGNDYLPSAGHMGVQYAFRAYKQLKHEPRMANKTLITLSPSFNWDFMQRLAAKVYETHPEAAQPPNHSRPHQMSQSISPESLLQGYASGLLWVLDMYLAGQAHHSTWQYFSGHRAPVPKEFATLPQPRHLTPPRSREPLPSPLESLVLSLPRGGRSLVPKGLRSVMDGGSKVRDVFMADHCAECLKLSRLEAAAHRDHAAALRRAQAQGKRSSEEVERSRATLASLAQRRQRHMKEDKRHLPRPFPFRRVKEAIHRVPNSQLTQSEAARRKFGKPLVLWNSHSLPSVPSSQPLQPPSPPGAWAKSVRSDSISSFQGNQALSYVLRSHSGETGSALPHTPAKEQSQGASLRVAKGAPSTSEGGRRKGRQGAASRRVEKPTGDKVQRAVFTAAKGVRGRLPKAVLK